MTAKTLADTRRLTLCAVMAAVMCVIAPISIPIGPISITGGTLAIYLAAYLLGGVWGTVSTLVYLLVGFVGLPVFSNYMGGAARLLGPTGGYLVGYLPMALLAGTVVQRSAHRFDERGKAGMVITLAVQFMGMALATAVLYAFGTAWYCIQAGVDLQKALAACVFPFIPWDLAKMVVALIVGAPVRRRLERANLL
ncbi:MAG: biotin transporter BioY [Clostridiales bacterium]|nr:biotin transporter BioY [Clostridiales bacterium]